MLSPYRVPPKSQKGKQNISNRELDLERPPMTSKEVTNENVKSFKSKSKNSLKDGFVHKNIEINEKQFDEFLHNKNFQMELAMQLISSGQTIRNDTEQVSKDFNSQSLATQTKIGQRVVSMIPAIKKAFNLKGDGKIIYKKTML